MTEVPEVSPAAEKVFRDQAVIIDEYSKLRKQPFRQAASLFVKKCYTYLKCNKMHNEHGKNLSKVRQCINKNTIDWENAQKMLGDMRIC